MSKELYEGIDFSKEEGDNQGNIEQGDFEDIANAIEAGIYYTIVSSDRSQT